MSTASQDTLIASIRRFSAALATADALNSLRLEGQTLAEITTLILQGTAANADKLSGQTLEQITTTMTGNATGLVDDVRAVLDAFIARRDNPNVVTAAQVGLGDVQNFPVATAEEATAGAADRYVTAALAQQVVAEGIAALAGEAPENLNSLAKLAAALENNPDIIAVLRAELDDIRTNGATTSAETQAAIDAKLDATAQAVDSALLEGRDVAALTAEILGGQAADSALLEGMTVAQITAAITGGSTETLLALREALDTFIAGKATAEDTTAGTDDTRYVTSLSLRAETDRAIAALVDGAPTALDTLNELAARLTTEGDALAELITSVDDVAGRADALEGRATAAEGRLDTAEGDIDALEGRATTTEGDVTALTGRVDTAETGLTDHGTRLDTVEGRVTTTEGRLDAVENGGTAADGRLDALEPRITTAEGDIAALQTDKLDATAQAVDAALLEGQNRQSILDEAAASVTAGDFATNGDLQDMADNLTTSFEDATDSIEGFTRARMAMGVADLGGARGFRAGTGGTLDPAVLLGAPVVEFSWAGTTGTVRVTGDLTGTTFEDVVLEGLVSTDLAVAVANGETTLTATFASTAGLPADGTVRAAVRYTA